MALTNIFREPRREITETVVGLAVVAGIGTPLGYVDYLMASALKADDFWPALILGPFLLMAGLIVIICVPALLLATIHAAGEGICDFLQKRGINLRPARR